MTSIVVIIYIIITSTDTVVGEHDGCFSHDLSPMCPVLS